MRRWLAVSAVLAAALTGCTNVDASPIGTGISPASAPASEQPLPPAGQHWKGLRAKCPELTSGAAQKLGAAGAGAPTDEYATGAVVTDADCHWGSSDGHGTAVDARVSIWSRQEAADAQWRTLSSGQTTPLRVGDVGLIADEAEAVVVRARSGNAVATVRLIPPTDRPDTGPLRQVAAEITDDVLDDLVAG